MQKNDFSVKVYHQILLDRLWAEGTEYELVCVGVQQHYELKVQNMIWSAWCPAVPQYLCSRAVRLCSRSLWCQLTLMFTWGFTDILPGTLIGLLATEYTWRLTWTIFGCLCVIFYQEYMLNLCLHALQYETEVYMLPRLIGFIPLPTFSLCELIHIFQNIPCRSIAGLEFTRQ